MSLLGRMQEEADREEQERRAGQPGSVLSPPPDHPRRRSGGTAALKEKDAHIREIKKRIQTRLLLDIREAKRRQAKEKKKQDNEPGGAKEQNQPGAKKPVGMLERRQVDDTAELRARIRDLFDVFLGEEGLVLSRREHQQLYEQIVADLLGYGPLEKLLYDEDTTDIMVVGPDNIFVERGGRVQRTRVVFDDEEHLRHIIDRIITPLGRRVDELSPMVDARLPDGSRVNVVIPPLAMNGSCLTIRKFSAIPLKAADLIRLDTAPPDVFEFLSAAVIGELNILISGGSGSGKTTLLNVLSGFIPSNERLVTIENAAELQLQQAHVVRLETRPANVEGEGELTMRELVINSLRMRPDRIIVGEVRGGEAIELLQAMNTGHEGSMSTIHANSPIDALTRLETMCLMAKMNLPSRAVREHIAAAVDIVVHMQRFRDGSRRIVQISELEGMEGDSLMLSDLFTWEQTSIDSDGRIRGVMHPTGIIPRGIERINDAGISLPPSTFGVVSYTGAPRRAFKDFRTAPPEPEVSEPEDTGLESAEPPPDFPPDFGPMA